jgi:hypothetical protein
LTPHLLSLILCPVHSVPDNPVLAAAAAAAISANLEAAGDSEMAFSEPTSPQAGGGEVGEAPFRRKRWRSKAKVLLAGAL